MYNSKTLPLLFLVTILASATLSQSAMESKEIKVNQQRIEDRIFELAKFGKDSSGKGYRVAYTKGDNEGRNWFIDLMKKAGLEVTIDYAGNIIGLQKGKNPSLKPIAFGSHIDMVPDGGNYDGCLGSIGALEMIEVLKERNIITNHPLQVMIFSNEEGATVGSSMLVNEYGSDNLKKKSQSGLSFAEGIKAIGGNPDSLNQIIKRKGDFAAFLELHIEQGGILDEEDLQIGIVEGIVGYDKWDVTIEGFANHAGTTPMNKRYDALLSAAKLIIAINDVINSYQGRQVGTVGKIAAQPGAYNVIPGKVVLGMEIRDLSFEKIERLFHDIEKKADSIATRTGTKITFTQAAKPVQPALADKTIQNKIENAAKKLGFTYQYLQSGAVQDAQFMASICPMGMIFVPSVGGISHSPKEFTRAIDMANGANVLLQTILMIDKE
jgi:N-carbamoyl-L-amino-acid hydrolase